MGKVVPGKWPFILIGIWVILIMGLGSWWLYLIVFLGNEFKKISSLSPESIQNINFVYMAKWEGLVFLLLLFLVSFFLLFIYMQDIKKANWMQAFFASVTHELKTPLASIRLQAEVMKDMIDSQSFSLNTFSDLTNRLLEDSQTLEIELEKILQLSIMERGGILNPVPINLYEFLSSFLRKRYQSLDFDLTTDHPHSSILADEFALSLIIRNLLNNTEKHRFINEGVVKPKVKMHISEKEKGKISLTYNDQGETFLGDQKRLGTLFYKHHSSKGSGIGLYLIKKLMLKMKGEILFKFSPSLQFILVFPEAQGETPYGEA